jgi:hypothetical protein
MTITASSILMADGTVASKGLPLASPTGLPSGVPGDAGPSLSTTISGVTYFRGATHPFPFGQLVRSRRPHPPWTQSKGER